MVPMCAPILGLLSLNMGIYLQHKNASCPLLQKHFAIFEDRDWYPNRLGRGLCCQKWQESKFLIIIIMILTSNVSIVSSV